MSNIKCLHLLYSGLGGVGVLVINLIKYNKEKHFQNEFIFIGIEPLLEEYQELCQQYNIPYKFILKKEGLDLKSILRLNYYVAQSNATHIISHGTNLTGYILPTTLLKRKSKILLYQHHAYKLLRPNERWILDHSYFFCNSLILLTNQYYEDIANKFKKKNRNFRVEVLNNSVDYDLYHQAVKPTVTEIPVLGMHGRMVTGKHFNLLIRAVKQLRAEGIPVRLQLAGTGTFLNDLIALTNSLGLSESVRFMGILSREGVANFLKQLDLYLMLTEAEGHNNCVLEAAAAGIPVIASDVDGVNAILQNDDTALLVPNDVNTIVIAIKKLLNNNELRMKIAARGQSQVKDVHNIDVYFQKFLAIIHRS